MHENWNDDFQGMTNEIWLKWNGYFRELNVALLLCTFVQGARKSERNCMGATIPLFQVTSRETF